MPGRKRNPMNVTISMIVKRCGLEKEFEDALENGRHFHLKVFNDPWTPLTIETLPQGTGVPPEISVTHYITENGELAQDPEMVFRIMNGRWEPVYYRLALMGVEHIAGPGKRLVMSEFVNVWARNLRNQGFAKKGITWKAGGDYLEDGVKETPPQSESYFIIINAYGSDMEIVDEFDRGTEWQRAHAIKKYKEYKLAYGVNGLPVSLHHESWVRSPLQKAMLDEWNRVKAVTRSGY